MFFDPGSLYALTVLVVVTAIITRVLIGTWHRRGEGGLSAAGRLRTMEDRIARIEEATSGLVAEFAAVRERERFMTQLVETRARKDARSASEASSHSSPVEESSPFVRQTVSAVRRVPGDPKG